MAGTKPTTPTTLPLDPDCRALEGARGTPAVLGDGLTWLLAEGGLNNSLDPVRDRLWDDSALSGKVDVGEVQEAAWVLLMANYELAPEEAADLIDGADPAALTDAVVAAMFGPEPGHRTYTEWATSALMANGLDPARVPTAMMPAVLKQLVDCRRCVPATEWIDSSIAAPRLAAARAAAARYAAKPPPNGTVATEPEPGPEGPPDEPR
jgi:hypothetical protein